LPAVLGADFSGRIHEIADDVGGFVPGDAVYGLGSQGRAVGRSTRDSRSCGPPITERFKFAVIES
jgi:NADPH:quinone reductase-like Zn-dependent oxidoreductase